MKWLARALLSAAILTVPGYFVLDLSGRIPPPLRDLPWPFALFPMVMAMVALNLVTARTPYLRAACLIIGIGAPFAIGKLAHARYQLPPASATTELGAPLPDIALHDDSGAAVRLRALTGRPTLLIWFRGSWCPYCRKQLAELAAELTHYSPADLQIVAVAADPPEPLRLLKQQLALPFTLLSDPERQLVNRCELGHCAAILDSTGIIRWAVVSGNWDKSLPAQALLQRTYRQR